MSRDEIINMVMIRMDEVTPFEEGAMVTSPLIASLLQEAANNIVLSFPAHLFTPSTGTSVTAQKNDDGSGFINAPSAMIKFLKLMMNGWERPVTTLYSTLDPVYKLQSDKYLRGKPSKPMAFHAHKEGQKGIEYYSVVGDTHTVNEFVYLSSIPPENMPDKLLSALAWETAKLAFMALQDPNGATISANNVQQQQMQFQQ